MAKVKKITVSNLKAVSALSVDFNGCTAIITGGNNKGKSSFLRSLPERLRGNKPDLILKQGEKEGSAEWELTSGEKFIWTFDGKKEKLTFVSERNIPQSVTKEISKMYFPSVFDVDAFLNSMPAKQKKTLQELTGIDFTEIDKVYKSAYDERTYANKKLADAKARLVFYDPKAPTEITPTDDLEAELHGIDAHNLRFENVEIQCKQKADKREENLKAISRLEDEIKALKENNKALDGEIIKGNIWMEDEKNAKKTNAEELKEKIAAIKQANASIEENLKAKELQEAHDKAAEEAKHADEEVKRIEAEKLEVIKNASMPDGFGFSDDGITYNGLEFNKDQLSSSAIYIAALKLAALGLGEVKTLHFDASFLDKNSLKDIEKWANENDLQLLIERPDFEGGEIEYQLVA